jgi:hypothetical protein
VDDVVPIPAGLLVDDSISAMLDYADRLWEPRADGSFVTHVVRRQIARHEGPDDVPANARAELVPFKLEKARDVAALVTFGPDRRPEHPSLPMILGSSIQIRLKAA